MAKSFCDFTGSGTDPGNLFWSAVSAFDQVDAKGQSGKQLPNAALNAFKNVNTATIKPLASDKNTPWGTAWGATTEVKNNESNDLDKSSKPFKFGAGQGSKISNSNLPPFADPRSYQAFQVSTDFCQCHFPLTINVATRHFKSSYQSSPLLTINEIRCFINLHLKPICGVYNDACDAVSPVLLW